MLIFFIPYPDRDKKKAPDTGSATLNKINVKVPVLKFFEQGKFVSFCVGCGSGLFKLPNRNRDMVAPETDLHRLHTIQRPESGNGIIRKASFEYSGTMSDIYLIPKL
jgi:hypothetical protein